MDEHSKMSEKERLQAAIDQRNNGNIDRMKHHGEITKFTAEKRMKQGTYIREDTEIDSGKNKV